MTRQESIDFYKENGFREIPNNLSGLSTDVLVRNNTVVRIGGDPGYSHFANLVVSNNPNLTNVVKIQSHEEPLGKLNNSNSNNEYSITEMELLSAMSHQESVDYEQWALPALNEIRQEKKPANDPFNLVEDMIILFKYAKKHNLGFDLVKPKNVMKRGEVFIILDPFA
ncbi:hypothetical protein NGC32_12605 [Kluyvera cryocrescens]|uniref:hypothetical protein n=1 Tax=Kluyvera cryocrescens TaxID=580 RepID=UPI002DBF8AD6|nr:hypothetical protein [Kluyvera cryocrescens]MEB7713561.1 hypothetical protein [Kluyvera cryocrescens]